MLAVVLFATAGVAEGRSRLLEFFQKFFQGGLETGEIILHDLPDFFGVYSEVFVGDEIPESRDSRYLHWTYTASFRICER